MKPQPFKITEHITFDNNRAQCPCCLTQGKTSKNLALIPNTDGAYKCHRGCSPEQIRDAIGQPKDRIVPTAIAKSSPPKFSTQETVDKATKLLLSSSKVAKKWLNDRGIDDAAIKNHQLGIVRKEYGGTAFWCVSIPYEYEKGSYLMKYFVSPWLPKEERVIQTKKGEEIEELRLKQDTGLASRFLFTKTLDTWDSPVQDKELWIVEGEWDAIILANIMKQNGSAIAICTCSTGCGNVPKDLTELGGYHKILIWYDLDEPGKNGAQKMAIAIGDRAKIATVPSPDNPKEGWDVSDALLAGYTLDNFFVAATESRSPDKKTNTLRDRLITTQELLDRAPDYVEFLIHDLLTTNELQVIAAPPRAGKSLLGLGIADSVASGKDFMGRPTQQGAVIYVNVEDGDAKLKERIVAQQWNPKIPVYWLTEFSLNEWDALLAITTEIKPKLIVIDTLTSVRDDDGDENSSKIASLLKPLKKAAKFGNFAVLLVHHTKKLNANTLADVDVFETMRGSGTIRSECRGAIVLAEVANKDTQRNEWRLIAENGSYARQDLLVVLDASNLTWKTLSNWTPNCSESQQSQVLTFLDKVGSASIDQISANTSVPAKSAYTVVTRLVQAGMLTKQGTRQNAVYIRPIQQIQQLDSLLNSPNDLAASNAGTNSTNQENTFFAGEPEKIITTIAVENTALCESVELEPQSHTTQAVGQFNKQFNKPDLVELGLGDFCVVANMHALFKEHPRYPVRRSNDLYEIMAIKGDKALVRSTNQPNFDRWLAIALLMKVKQTVSA
jgi:AAA domain/Toprim-like